jgi:hypothetical protein
VEALGAEAELFVDAIARFARAVDVADRARRQWIAEGRPLIARNPNGADGVGVLLRVVMDSERAAAGYGASLGLDPMSARKLARVGVQGRPMGAASAPDRQMPPRMLMARPGLKVASTPEPPEIELKGS